MATIHDVFADFTTTFHIPPDSHDDRYLGDIGNILVPLYGESRLPPDEELLVHELLFTRYAIARFETSLSESGILRTRPSDSHDHISPCYTAKVRAHARYHKIVHELRKRQAKTKATAAPTEAQPQNPIPKATTPQSIPSIESISSIESIESIVKPSQPAAPQAPIRRAAIAHADAPTLATHPLNRSEFMGALPSFAVNTLK